MQRQQQGFTLIELVIVIVILGILSAFALPRFADLGSDAREASIKGLEGSMKSASSIVYSACLAADVDTCDQNATSDTTVVQGQTITLSKGFPTPSTSGILAAAQINSDDFDLSGESNDVNALTVAAKGAPGKCEVVHGRVPGRQSPGSGPPDISTDVSGC